MFEVPKTYQKVQGFITAVGAPSQAINYDIDMFLYDANCAVTLAYQAVGNDESGVLAKGTPWILIHAFEGEPNLSAHIELKGLGQRFERSKQGRPGAWVFHIGSGFSSESSSSS